jgi:hypothetical protein
MWGVLCPIYMYQPLGLSTSKLLYEEPLVWKILRVVNNFLSSCPRLLRWGFPATAIVSGESQPPYKRRSLSVLRLPAAWLRRLARVVSTAAITWLCTAVRQAASAGQQAPSSCPVAVGVFYSRDLSKAEPAIPCGPDLLCDSARPLPQGQAALAVLHQLELHGCWWSVCTGTR